MDIIAILGLIFLTIKVLKLSGKINSLEGKMSAMSMYVAKPSVQNIASQQTPLNTNVQSDTPVYESVTVEPYQEISTEPDQLTAFFAWFKENWLLKLGVLLILVGFGWFISYAFIHDWIGPFGRVTLGFIIGSVLALYGTLRMEKNITQGKLFLILGSALVVITSYAAQAVYGFFPAVVGLGIIFLVSVYVATTALLYKMKNIAVYGLVIAFLAPLLTHTTADIKLLFSYLIVVSLASIWLASIKGWREINAIALFGFSWFAAPYVFGFDTIGSSDESFILITIFGLGLIYFFVSIMGAIKNQEAAEKSDIFVAIFDSALIILATINFIPEEVQSLVLAAWMIVFAIGSFLAFTYTKKENFFYVYSLISILLLAIATAIELQGATLVYAYAIESAIISILGYVVTRKIDVGYNLSILMIGPVIMSFPSLVSSKWSSSVLHDDFGILFTVGTLLFSLGLFYFYSEKEMKNYNDTSNKHFYSALCAIGSIYFLALIWLVSGASFINNGTAVFVSLVIYTIIGIATYFYGLIESSEAFKHYGGILLIFVIARLVFVDVWDMELAKRIITFISIGVLFISTAFIGKKVKDDLPKNITTN